MSQAGKLFNKLTKMAAAKLKEDNKLGIREDSTDSGGQVLAQIWRQFRVCACWKVPRYQAAVCGRSCPPCMLAWRREYVE